MLFAAERFAIAAYDENTPASTEEALSEADAQDSTGPALSTPSNTDEQQHGTSANAPHTGQWKYGQQSQQARTAPNRAPQRVAQRPDYRNYNQSYDQSRAEETQQNQQAQHNGAYYPQNSAPAKPQPRDAGMLPNYQQQQHKYSSEETSGQNNQSEGQAWQRGQQSAGNPNWQRNPQSGDWQSGDQQQNRRPQQQNNVPHRLQQQLSAIAKLEFQRSALA